MTYGDPKDLLSGVLLGPTGMFLCKYLLRDAKESGERMAYKEPQDLLSGVRLVRAAEAEAEERRGAGALFFIVYAAGVGVPRVHARWGASPPLEAPGCPLVARRYGRWRGNPLGESQRCSVLASLPCPWTGGANLLR